MRTKIILLMLLLVAFKNSINAQKNSVRFGLRGGTYFSRFDVSPKYNGEYHGEDALYGGIQVQIPLRKNLYVTTEALYAISQLTFNALPSDEINFLLIPVMVKYQAGHWGFYAGGQGNVLTKARARYSIGGEPHNDNVIDSSYKKLSFAGVAGIEFVFKYRFGIDVRYQHGFSNIRASNGSTLFTRDGTVRMNAFQTGLFYRFGKKQSKQHSENN
jgi:hypothetical protein